MLRWALMMTWGATFLLFLNTLALLGHGARGMPLSFYSISFILATICKVWHNSQTCFRLQNQICREEHSDRKSISQLSHVECVRWVIFLQVWYFDNHNVVMKEDTMSQHDQVTSGLVPSDSWQPLITFLYVVFNQDTSLLRADNTCNNPGHKTMKVKEKKNHSVKECNQEETE